MARCGGRRSGLCGIHSWRESKASRLLRKSQIQLDKELDLHNFIRSFRLHRKAIMAILTVPRFLFVEKLSRVLVRESTTSGSTEEKGGGFAFAQRRWKASD